MSSHHTCVSSSRPVSFDRYRPGLKGTWKDQPLPGAGMTYDLGAHLIDQTLQLFGRPEKLTAFLQNVRGIGHPEVDDTVRLICLYLRRSIHDTHGYRGEWCSLRSCCTTLHAPAPLIPWSQISARTLCPSAIPKPDILSAARRAHTLN